MTGKTSDEIKRRGYTDADLAEAADFPEMTDEQLAAAKPFAEVLPELAASLRRRGKQRAPTKVPVSIRLDANVVKRFKADGPGWQARMGEVLRKAVGL